MMRLLGAEAMFASAAFLALLGVLVLAAQPRRALNRACGVLLLANAGAVVTFQLMRQAPDAETALLWLRAAQAFDPLVLLFSALLVHLLFPPAPGARRRRWLLGAVAALSAILLLASLHDWRLLSNALARSAPGAAWDTSSTPLTYLSLAATWTVQAAAVLLAARAAASPLLTSMQRRQAALVGLSFAFVVGHSAALRLASLPFRVARAGGFPFTPDTPWHPALDAAGIVLMHLVALLGLAAVVAAAPRLARAFDGPARHAVLGVVALVLAFGAFDGSFRVVLAPLATWYFSSRFLWVGAAAACLALAFVRHDLGGLAERTRRRVTILSHVSLVLLAVVLPAGLTLALGEGSSAAVILALLLGLAALTLSPAPLRTVARALARALLADPRDPAALGDSARAYAAALEARMGTHGEAPPPDDPALRALRDELGLHERDHAHVADVVRAHRARAAHPAATEAPLLLGRYRVERELGRGAYGTTYLATHAGTGARVVLKRMHAGDADRRILAEARALQAVRHPRVVPLVEVDRAGRESFLVLGYVEGGSAHDLLAREGPLPPARAASLALDALEGLAALHAAGIVHADVKLGNLLLDRDGRGVLADLGSAIGIPRAEESATLTASAGAGTYATLAPERLRGGRPSPSADLYAVGAVLYRLLTGEDYVAMDGKSAYESGDAILHDAPRLPHPRVPAPLASVISRALAKTPEERYASAAEMGEALRGAMTGEVSTGVMIRP